MMHGQKNIKLLNICTRLPLST